MEAIHVNHDPKGWGPSSLKFPQIEGVEPTDDLTSLYSYIDFGQKASKREEEPDDFFLVDNKLQSGSKLMSKYGQFFSKVGAAPKSRAAVPTRVTTVARPVTKRIYRDQTVSIRSNWSMIAELSKPNNDKLSFEPGVAEDISQYGSILTYKRSQDTSVSALSPKILNTKVAESRAFISSTASADPLLEALKDRASVFITDTVLVTIMTMNRSVYPWDIQVTKSNGKIVFDKSEDSSLEQLTLNENNPEHMPDEDEPETSINNPKRLAEEAQRVNRAFFLSSIAEPSVEFGANFNEENLPIAVKYRKWQLSESFGVLVRTEIDSVIEENDNKVLIKLFAVNEYDAKITGGYKEKLETKKGQIFANEIKNNSCKMSKWALKAYLAGVEFVKIGYVSRANPNVNDRHLLLHVQKIRTKDLMQDLNLSHANGWGVFRAVVEIFKNQPDGRYVMVKDPLKPVVKIYTANEDHTEDFETR